MGLFDTGYGETRRGIGWYPRQAPQAAPMSLWDLTEAAAMTPVPGVADVASGALAARDFSEGRPLSGLLNAAGTLPLVPALGQIFIGVKGANKAQKQALVTAQKMAKEGAKRDEIWNATLWYKGNDGKWRTEIDDSAVPVKKVLTEDTLWSYPNALDVFPHKELARAYPDMGALKLGPEYGGARGAYDARQGVISIEPITDAENIAKASGQRKRTAIHEFSHVVQANEGHARGGSPDEFLRQKWTAADAIEKQIDDLNKQMGKAVGTPKYDELMGKRAALVKQLSEAGLLDPVAIREAAHNDYFNLAGEAEARLAANRMNLTMPERQAMPPWSEGPYGWDVPEADQIVRMEGGQAMLRGLLGR